jgi:hypothetical protein
MPRGDASSTTDPEGFEFEADRHEMTLGRFWAGD